MASNGALEPAAARTNRSQQTSHNGEMGRALKSQLAELGGADRSTASVADSYGRYGRPKESEEVLRASTLNIPVGPPSDAVGGDTRQADAPGDGAQKDGHARKGGSGGPLSSIRSVSNMIHNKVSAYREEGDFTLGCSKVFQTRTRFLMMVLLLLCLASVWSNILCFNFALICVNDEIAQHKAGTANTAAPQSLAVAVGLNGTAPDGNATGMATAPAAHVTEEDNESNLYSANQRLYLTSAVAAAALIANFVVVSLVNTYGIRTVFALLGLLSAASTCFMPVAISMGYYYVLAARVLQGVAFSANFPVIGSFGAKWTYYKQNGLFVSVLVAYVQLAPAVTMTVSGTLCSTVWGWPSVFYAHGCVSVALFLLFAVFYRNSPAKHPLVGDIEMRKIAVGKSELDKAVLKKIPYAEILKTAAVWAVWIAALGNFWCVNMMFLYSPKYLHGVLGFSVRHTGFSASLAPLAQFCIKLFAGFTSDKVRFLSETNKLRMYNSIAFIGSAFFLTVLAFFDTQDTFACLVLLGMSAGVLGFTTGGFFKAGPLVSKHYSHFVTGNVSLGITLTMLFVPVMMTLLAPDNTAAQWRNVFLCTAGVLFLTNLLFVVMSSAEPASWTTDEFSRNASRTNKIYSTAQTTPGKMSLAMG